MSADHPIRTLERSVSNLLDVRHGLSMCDRIHPTRGLHPRIRSYIAAIRALRRDSFAERMMTEYANAENDDCLTAGQYFRRETIQDYRDTVDACRAEAGDS